MRSEDSRGGNECLEFQALKCLYVWEHYFLIMYSILLMILDTNDDILFATLHASPLYLDPPRYLSDQCISDDLDTYSGQRYLQ